MKNQVPLFRTIDKRLNVGLVISVACIILVEFVFNNTDELFSGGEQLGEILSNLSLAFLASYIFYVVVVHIKYVKNKEHLDPYIELKNRQLVNAIRVLTQSLILKAGEDADIRYPNKHDLFEAAKKASLSAPAPYAYQRMYPHIKNGSTRKRVGRIP